MVKSLCNQLLPGFSVNRFQTMCVGCCHDEDVHIWSFGGDKINFDRMMAF